MKSILSTTQLSREGKKFNGGDTPLDPDCFKRVLILMQFWCWKGKSIMKKEGGKIMMRMKKKEMNIMMNMMEEDYGEVDNDVK
jgi:hypothetical protein